MGKSSYKERKHRFQTPLPGSMNIDAMLAFQEYMNVEYDDPSVAPDLELWLAAWNLSYSKAKGNPNK